MSSVWRETGARRRRSAHNTTVESEGAGLDSTDLRRLIASGVASGERWAELGSGEGNFTLTLAELLGEQGSIVSVDWDSRAIATQRRRLAVSRPGATVEHRIADFTADLGLSGLDGILMANCLHFLPDPTPVLRLVRGYLAGGGRLLVVEYDSDRGNHWVPHPFSYSRWAVMAAGAGFSGTRVLARYPGRFLGGMYSALSELL